MQLFEIVDEALAMPDSTDFGSEMRPELQSRLLQFSESDWQQLKILVQHRSAEWQRKLCTVLSPVKHGQVATDLLLAFAEKDPSVFWAVCVARLLAHQAISEGERQHLTRLFTQLPQNQQRKNQARYEQELLAALQKAPSGPPIAAASEFSSFHKAALENCKSAACYECLQVFATSEISEFTDGDETALCPFCGIDAVLPESAGFSFTQDSLEALHEYWFR